MENLEQAERMLVDMTIAANRRVCAALREDSRDMENIPESVVADYAPFLPQEDAEQAADFIRNGASVLRVEIDGREEWHAGPGEFSDILLEKARIADADPETKATMRDQATAWIGEAVKTGKSSFKFGDRTIRADRVMFRNIMEGEIQPASWEKMVGKGVEFERIRRITGYLVGSLNRFNNAKRAEERDRVKHGMSM